MEKTWKKNGQGRRVDGEDTGKANDEGVREDEWAGKTRGGGRRVDGEDKWPAKTSEWRRRVDGEEELMVSGWGRRLDREDECTGKISACGRQMDELTGKTCGQGRHVVREDMWSGWVNEQVKRVDK